MLNFFHHDSCGNHHASWFMWESSCIVIHVGIIMYRDSCGNHHASWFMWESSCIVIHVGIVKYRDSCMNHHASWFTWESSCIVIHVGIIMNRDSCRNHHISWFMYESSCIVINVGIIMYRDSCGNHQASWLMWESSCIVIHVGINMYRYFRTSSSVKIASNIFSVPSSSSVANYRPISITPVLSKVFEGLVEVRFGRFMEHCGVHPTTQFAYRKGLGTCDAFLCVSHTLQSALIGERAGGQDCAGRLQRCFW